MPAVIRVKRRIEEEPLSAFVLNGKKRRLEDGSAEETDGAAYAVPTAEANADPAAEKEISTVLKFAATIAKQDDEITKQLAHSSKQDAKDIVLRRKLLVENLTERSRDEARQHSKENRFRIVNLSRTNAIEPSAQEVTILDVERELENGKQAIASVEEKPSTSTAHVSALSNGNAQPADSDSGYVYDLYLADDEQQSDRINDMDDNYMSVGVYQPELETFDCADEDDDDSEDSNNENFYGNDYPDESSGNEDNENAEYDGDAYYDGQPDAMNQLQIEFENFIMGDDDDVSDAHSSSDGEFHQVEDYHAFHDNPQEGPPLDEYADYYFDAADTIDLELADSDDKSDEDDA